MRLITTPTVTMSMQIQMRAGNQTNKDAVVKPQNTDKRAVFCEMCLNCKLQINRMASVWEEEGEIEKEDRNREGRV